MKQFIHVTPNKFEFVKVARDIPLSELKNRVGVVGEDAYIECVYNQFSHSRTIIVCDESGRLKNLPIVAITRRGTAIHGCFIIAGLEQAKDEYGWNICGIPEARIPITLNETRLVLVC